MEFNAKWITTEDFAPLVPIDMFHKENDEIKLPESPFKNYHIHFRKKFTLHNTDNVCINISADDYYKLYVNGVFVCQGPAPAYPECYNYNRVDISDHLKCGDNVIAVHVHYQGVVNRVCFSADNRQGMIADIYQDDNFIFGTDESWLYSQAREFSGELTGYETLFLENIDFNLEEKGWTEPEFDDSAYKKAVIKKSADYRFKDQPAITVDVYKKLPDKVIKFDKGKYFIDFGEEITGQFYMSAKGIKGQTVRIMCGEEIEENDPLIVKYDMLCNCCYDETCVLSGKGDEFNFYDYKGFRYVNVFTDEDNLDEKTFCAIVRHHPFEEKYSLKTGIPYLKDIWKICSNGVKYGSQGAILDCPTREKGLYLGDFTVSGLARLYLTDDAEYYKKILYDFAATSTVCPGIMAVANCSFMQEIADCSLQYPLQILNYYNHTKDKATVQDLYPTVCGILEYFKRFERADGLLENVHEKNNIVDWPANLRDDYDAHIALKTYGIDCHNVLNAFYIGALQTVNELRTIIGIEEKIDILSKKQAFIKAFYNKETKLFCDTEKQTHSALHSNALPLYFGIADEDMKEDIKSFIMKKGLSCGVQFAYFVLKGLGKIGAYEEELELLINETEHSWVNMLKEGASTCFEAWGKPQKWNTSLCHPWASAPILILFEDLKNKFGITIEANS